MQETLTESALEIRRYHALEDAHSHAYHQILLPLHGLLDLETGHEKGLAGGNVGALIASESRHHFASKTESRFLVIDLPEGVLDLHRSGAQSTERTEGFFALSPALRHLTRFAEESILEDRYADLRPMILPLVTQVLKADGFTPRNHKIAALSKACLLIETHYDHALTYDRLADECGITEARLISLFRRWLNCTPAEYLSRVRLSAGHDLLSRTDLSIAEIAQRTGYSEQSAFTRGFARHYGITPGRFRKTGRIVQ